MDKKLGCVWCNDESRTAILEVNITQQQSVVVYLRGRNLTMCKLTGNKSEPLVGVPVNFCPSCGRELNPRPMTLDEAKDYKGPAYLEWLDEDNKTEGDWVIVVGYDEKHDWIAYDERMCVAVHHYGSRRRFWKSEPTQERSAEFPWEEKKTKVEFTRYPFTRER